MLLTGLDYPDPDVIRVNDIYYMVTTTMHFMPGCEILQSRDLVHWEHLTYVYDVLDGTAAQALQNGKNIYGKGMWAATFRYHQGVFYICFAANDTGKTYLFRSNDLQGKWVRSQIQGFYHDSSLLFDDDKVYIVYGNRDIYLTELAADLSGPKDGGLHRMLISDQGNPNLGYEGSHIYKINGKYYLFCIHSKREYWRRVEACFFAETLEDEFIGRDIFDEDMGYCHQGIAQGGIVDTPTGEWYAVLFQDRGAVGRIPVLVQVCWENEFPVMRLPKQLPNECTEYNALCGSDDFIYSPVADFKEMDQQYGCYGLKSMWQFNHAPDLSLITPDRQKGSLSVRTALLCNELTQARNTLTQRMQYPGCSGEITLDFSKLKSGDYAGICILQEDYAMAAVTRREDTYYIVMQNKDEILEEIPICGEQTVTLKAMADFSHMKDVSTFYYLEHGQWKQIGKEHKLHFSLAHFTGCRLGLFYYATKEIGGKVDFMNFIYKTMEDNYGKFIKETVMP
ncbi:MAG: glycosyl hydrolase 43 family protein [Lachnospiraceae bacterium]|nr:glycosyl hydrolase 43 family protein [Lachnospiraceae bacterium]